MVLPIVGLAFTISQQPRESSTDATAGQPDLHNSSFRLSSQVILGYVKVTVKTNQQQRTSDLELLES